MEFLVLIGIAWLVFAWLKKKDTDSAANPVRVDHERSNLNSEPSKPDAQIQNRTFVSSSSHPNREPTAALIQRAIDSKKALKFRYVDQNGAITQRTVTPNHLESRHDSETLCLVAHCHLRGASRTFVVRRIRHVSIK
jgi:predicted DNA-binding transcriptional regulator YafY